jgi:hypothetical protein
VSTHRLFNTTMALLIAALMATSHLLDGPSDLETERLIADDIADAVQTAAAAAAANTAQAGK